MPSESHFLRCSESTRCHIYKNGWPKNLCTLVIPLERLLCTVVLHSERLLFVNLFTLSTNLYRCLSLARLPLTPPPKCGFHNVFFKNPATVFHLLINFIFISVISSFVVLISFISLLLFPAFLEPLYFIVAVSTKYHIFFWTSTFTDPTRLSVCLLSIFKRHIFLVLVLNVTIDDSQF